MTVSMSNKIVRVSDTTLRDGEQAPGFSMTPREKLLLAQQLERLGVDRIDAGFPAVSANEFECVVGIAKALKQAEVMGMARCVSGDIEAAARALESAAKPVIQPFVPVSDLHLKHKVGWSRQECLDRAAQGTELANRLFGEVQFGIEDASRADPDFLDQLIKVVVGAGAKTINIADTVGYTLPEEWALTVRRIVALPEMQNVVLSVHGHDDLGLAVANVLAAVQAGARQIECTVCGIGERAGNTALEEVVMILKTRDIGGLDTNLDPREFTRTCRLLTAITGHRPPTNKAIVGSNAFAHGAGIHQDGVLKNPLTYEIMTPESVGGERRTMVLGKHSGRAGLADRLDDLGFELTKDELDKAYERFSAVADAKQVVHDEDLMAIVDEATETKNDVYVLESLQYSNSGSELTSVTVQLRRGGERFIQSSVGNGPFAACAQAIDQAVGHTFSTEVAEAFSNTRGRDSMGHVVAQLSDETGHQFVGKASSTDVVEALAKAYLSAVNQWVVRGGEKHLVKQGRRHSQADDDLPAARRHPGVAP
jgi:2-isopropylmalate synthase